MIDEGKQLFFAKERDYFGSPKYKAWTCMVDLLGQADKLDEALKSLENIKIEKDEVF
jgi:hypothetical protein